MYIRSTLMRVNKEQCEEQEQESIASNNDGTETIEQWVKWFRKELLEAFKAGEDVEILIGRRTPEINGYVA